MRRWQRSALVAALAVSTVFVAEARAEVLPPAGWPATSTTKPMITGWPNALRISGNNRYQTGLAAALTLHGSGDDESYPFGSPDPATTKGWWGLNSCPRAIIVVAGDSPADALAASTLSDPTGQSTEPLLQRSAAADPLFYPPGGFARVDTDFAPILSTTSARSGATSLDVATRLAAQDLHNGGCKTARQAIIVGGTRAVASTVDTELVSIGYDEVFRVSGGTRYSTARLIAQALGTAPLPNGFTESSCLDDRVDDGEAETRFYSNSSVEYRPTARTCRLLSRTVVLADGVSGADALAAGWWTSYWQVPIVLHDGGSDLPRQTREALETLGVDHVIVLGGTSRISDAVAEEAKDASGADEVIRIAGSDRYATSVEMAKVFGGWWPSGDGANFAGSTLCIAASSGGGSSGSGWPDALAAGPWCARAGQSAVGAPTRALMPLDGPEPALTNEVGSLVRPARAMAPVVLVPTGASILSSAVTSFLAAAFPTGDGWCTSAENGESCSVPGFAVVFGGPSVVTDAQVGLVSKAVGGGIAAGSTNPTPNLTSAFATRLDLSPVFSTPASVDDLWVCITREAATNVRWLINQAGSTTRTDAYVNGFPACSPVSVGSAGEVVVSAAGVAANRVFAQREGTFSLDDDDWLALSDAIATGVADSAEGVDSTDDSSEAGETTWTFVVTNPGVQVTSRGETASITSATLEITLVRGTNTSSVDGPDTFTGEFTLETSAGRVRGTLLGEALLIGDTWSLRGIADFDSGSWNFDRGSGGFVADLSTESLLDSSDDTVVWRIDGIN